MKWPKVLVFTTIYDKKDYCLEEFVENAKKLTYPNMRHIYVDNTNDDGEYLQRLLDLGLDAHHVQRGGSSREALARSQNFARKMALDDEYDYLFSLESDLFPGGDVIQKLMRHCKDVVTALYLLPVGGTDYQHPCVTLKAFNQQIGAWGTRLLTIEEVPQYKNAGLKRVQAGGFGVCLMSRRAFSMKAFMFDPRFLGHSDVYFFNEMFKAQVPVFVDTDLFVEHKHEGLWSDVEDV